MDSTYFWNCVGRCSQLHSDDDCEECVVAMHIPPIKGIAHADAGSQWQQIGIWRRGHDVEHGSRGSRAVDE